MTFKKSFLATCVISTFLFSGNVFAEGEAGSPTHDEVRDLINEVESGSSGGSSDSSGSTAGCIDLNTGGSCGDVDINTGIPPKDGTTTGGGDSTGSGTGTTTETTTDPKTDGEKPEKPALTPEQIKALTEKAKQVKGTANYLVSPRVAFEQGINSAKAAATHRNELAFSNSLPEDQLWVETYGNKNEIQSKEELSFETKDYGLLVGYDKTTLNEGGGYYVFGGHIGVSDTKTDLSFNDQKFSSNKSTRINLGLDYTFYTEDDAYLDILTQVAVLHNKYKNEDTYSQNGFNFLTSVEVGKQFGISDNFYVEPQAQAIYQFATFNKITVDDIELKQPDAHDLRARVGAKLGYKGDNGLNLYTKVNLWHSFVNKTKFNIKAKDDLTLISDELKFDNGTWTEIGVGAKIPLSKAFELNSSFNYEKELSGKKRKGYNAQLGLKYQF